ncbi:MAG: hypothetical protein ABIF82_03600 [Planctomycetota bacterium]
MHDPTGHVELTLQLLAQAERDPARAEYIERRLATLVPSAVAEGRALFAERSQPAPALAAKPELIGPVTEIKPVPASEPEVEREVPRRAAPPKAAPAPAKKSRR